VAELVTVSGLAYFRIDLTVVDIFELYTPHATQIELSVTKPFLFSHVVLPLLAHKIHRETELQRMQLACRYGISFCTPCLFANQGIFVTGPVLILRSQTVKLKLFRVPCTSVILTQVSVCYMSVWTAVFRV